MLSKSMKSIDGKVNNKLFCVYVFKDSEAKINGIVNKIYKNYDIYNGKIFLLELENKDYILTFSADTSKRVRVIKNVFFVHRNSATNTLYSINALNLLLIDSTINLGKKIVDFSKYKDSILLQADDAGLNAVKMTISKVFNDPEKKFKKSFVY